jgi:hypothetical protein
MGVGCSISGDICPGMSKHKISKICKLGSRTTDGQLSLDQVMRNQGNVAQRRNSTSPSGLFL